MVSKKPSRSDFENRYYDLLQDSMDRLETEVKYNIKLTEQVKHQADRTNGKVEALEKEVFNKIKPSDLPPMWRDPKVLSTIFNISLAILVLIAAITRVNVSDLIP